MICRHRPGVSSRTIDGEVVIVDREGDKIHQLNSTASFVWNMIDGSRTLASIAEEMTEAYDVAYEDALADAKKIAVELEQLQLVHVGGSE